jgi:hypothetical protein
MKCTQRLYLTKDRKKLVGESGKGAASLYAVPGDEIPQSAAEMFGLVGGHLKDFDLDAASAGDQRDKEKRDAENKAKQEAKAKREKEAEEAAAKERAEGGSRRQGEGRSRGQGRCRSRCRERRQVRLRQGGQVRFRQGGQVRLRQGRRVRRGHIGKRWGPGGRERGERLIHAAARPGQGAHRERSLGCRAAGDDRFDRRRARRAPWPGRATDGPARRSLRSRQPLPAHAEAGAADRHRRGGDDRRARARQHGDAPTRSSSRTTIMRSSTAAGRCSA